MCTEQFRTTTASLHKLAALTTVSQANRRFRGMEVSRKTYWRIRGTFLLFLLS